MVLVWILQGQVLRVCSSLPVSFHGPVPPPRSLFPTLSLAWESQSHSASVLGWFSRSQFQKCPGPQADSEFWGWELSWQALLPCVACLAFQRFLAILLMWHLSDFLTTQEPKLWPFQRNLDPSKVWGELYLGSSLSQSQWKQSLLISATPLSEFCLTLMSHFTVLPTLVYIKLPLFKSSCGFCLLTGPQLIYLVTLLALLIYFVWCQYNHSCSLSLVFLLYHFVCTLSISLYIKHFFSRWQIIFI